MRYLIVAPRYGAPGKYYEFPLGLAYISAVFKRNGYPVTCCNLNHQNLGALPAENDVLLTGGLSIHYTEVRRIIRDCRILNPNIKVVVGGGLITSEPALMAEALTADVAVEGEGEGAALRAALDLERKRPLRFYGPLDPIKDPGLLPFPDYEGFGIDAYLRQQHPEDCYYLPEKNPRAVPIIGSRGCPFNCTFCFHPCGRGYRQRTLDSVFSEIEYLVSKYNVNTFAVVDELFALDPHRVEQFCYRINEYKVNWICQMRVSDITRTMVKGMKSSGCTHISLGLESMSLPVLKSMDKHITPAQIEAACEILYSEGVRIQGNFIFGDKAETPETVRETLAWWRGHRRYGINLCHLIPFPGSPLYQWAVEKGRIPNRLAYIEAGCPTVNFGTLSDADFREMHRLIQEAQAEV